MLLHHAARCSALPPPLPAREPHPTTTHRRHRHRHYPAYTPKPFDLFLSADVLHLLDEIPLSDTFTWNSLLLADDDNPLHALLLYRHMLLRGARPDRHTLPRVLAAARLSPLPSPGLQLHAHALKLGLASDPYVVSALMLLYARFESASAAAAIFHFSDCTNNPVSWTLLAKLYLAENNPALALQVFHQMVDAGAELDSVTLATALKGCRQLKSIKESKKVLEVARKRGLELDVLVANSVLKMFLECGKIEEARALFDGMSLRDAVSWTTVICWYVQNGEFNEGLKLFRAMCSEGMVPDAFAVSAILPACARMAARKYGKEIHGQIFRRDIPMHLTVMNALVDMYVKSGSLEDAVKIFERMTEKDVISWTVMIAGCSLHGEGELGVALFRKMEEQASVSPDGAAYVATLSACSTALMVEEGWAFFKCISRPDVDHFALIVRLLSRAGQLKEARDFVENHQIGSHPEALRAILDGCRIYQDVNLGKRIAEQLVELEPLNAENYVLLSNVYAANAKWDMVKELREIIRDMGLRSKSGYSWIEVHSKIHVFSVGDVSHPRSERIYWEIGSLRKKMEEEECVPEEDFSLHDVDEERECIPNGHSELLAIGFGLISTQTSTTLRVTKNLRVCRNCHSSAKMISKIMGRQIVLKDPERFHHFRDGSCSCGDVW